MYDAYNAEHEDLLEVLKEIAIDEINWCFAEAFQNQN